jgi:microcystin-dependent protein
MPRNGTGTMSIVNTASPNTVITSSDYNENFADVADEITNSLALDGQSAMTGQLKAAGGTASAPGVTFGADSNTGAYSSAADEYSVATGGTQRLAISSSGLDVKSGNYLKAGIVMSLVPIGTVLDYAGASEPGGWLFCYGQAISRTTYASLFAVVGTTYGAGDGATTFNLPDLRGRVVAGQDDMGGTSANRLTGHSGGLDGDTLGATGGSETHALTTAQLAQHSHGVSITSQNGTNHTHSIGGNTGPGSQHSHNLSDANVDITAGGSTHQHTGTTGTELADHAHAYTRFDEQVSVGRPDAAGTETDIWQRGQSVNTGGANANHTHSFTTNADEGGHVHGISGTTDNESLHTHSLPANTGNPSAHTHLVSGNTGNEGSGAAHNNVQPTIILNKIIFAGA